MKVLLCPAHANSNPSKCKRPGGATQECATTFFFLTEVHVVVGLQAVPASIALCNRKRSDRRIAIEWPTATRLFQFSASAGAPRTFALTRRFDVCLFCCGTVTCTYDHCHEKAQSPTVCLLNMVQKWGPGTARIARGGNGSICASFSTVQMQ